MEQITTLNAYQEATNTVAVYPGSDPSLTQGLVATLFNELLEATKQPGAAEEGANEGLRALAPLLGVMKNAGLIYTSLGLAGESGEFCDKVKKMLRDNGGALSPEMRMSKGLELGDILWYVAQSAKQLGFSLEEIANMNMEKLLDRKARSALGGSGDSR